MSPNNPFGVVQSFYEGFVTSLKSPSEVKLGSKAYTIVRKIGEGGFSYVYLVKESRPRSAGGTSPTFALKEVRIQLPEQEERIRGEIAALANMDSPYILKLLDSVIISKPSKDAKAFLLFPFYSHGTVQDMIEKGSLEMPRILQIARDVAYGLKAFHSRSPPLAFRDLKPANILINDDGQAVLMDLGSVTEANVNLSTRKDALALQDLCAETVTAPFRAPELFEPQVGQFISSKTDIWALGCTLYAMAYGQPPFDGTATATVCGKVEFPRTGDRHPESLRTLIQSLLEFSSESRPTIYQVTETLERLLITHPASNAVQDAF
ncbi:kinase-like domain-containing protein [Chytridium lagenaria]|nr:kinase-like domain-containing protein [Chytridium lagenaria]